MFSQLSNTESLPFRISGKSFRLLLQTSNHKAKVDLYLQLLHEPTDKPAKQVLSELDLG